MTDEQRHAVFVTFLLIAFLAIQSEERDMLKMARTAVAGVLTVVAIAWLLVSCAAPLPSTDAGADPEISQCCNWWLVPLLYDEPQVCLDEHTAEGECRWLTCLGGVVTYRSSSCE